MITILLVDDHAVLRQGVAAYLSSQENMTIVGEATSGLSASKLIEELAPDVILIDLLMPEMDGVEATRQIKNISPHSKVVYLDLT